MSTPEAIRMAEVSYGEAMPVESYGPGFIRIAGQVIRGPVLVSPWQAEPWGGLEDTETPLRLLGRIDVLFIGMGDDIAHAPRPFRAALEAAGIGVEVMSTPAACRTYNVLLGEQRRVAIALLPVGGQAPSE